MLGSPHYYGRTRKHIERSEMANPSLIRRSARDGVLSVAPQAAITSGASALGGTAATGVGLVQGAALEASKYRKWVKIIARGAEGFWIPVSPVGASGSGKAGTLVSEAIDEIKRWHYRNNRTQRNATDI